MIKIPLERDGDDSDGEMLKTEVCRWLKTMIGLLSSARFFRDTNEKRWETVAGGVMSREHGRWGAGTAARTKRTAQET